MKPILILYATREGQTRRIAGHIAEQLRQRDITVEVVNAGELTEPLRLDYYGAALLAGSVHLGKHERELVRFVRRHRPELERLPSAFLSVSMSEASVEDERRAPAQRARARRDVQQVLDGFLRTTGWHPTHVVPVAGALPYTRYNPLIRFLMKLIARRSGSPTDTTRDHEFTDWAALDRFTSSFAEECAH